MSALHTINKSTTSRLLEDCLAVIGEGDAILFIEDGVYCCASKNALRGIADSNRLYGLREDMIARAILSRADESVEAIDMTRFVELCGEHDKVVSWF